MNLFMLILIPILAACVGFAYWFFTIKPYNVSLIIYEKRAGSWKPRLVDRGKRITNKHNGKTAFRLRKLKKITQPFNYNDIYSVGKSNFVILLSINPDVFQPASIDEKGNIKAIPEDRRFWQIQRTSELVRRTQKDERLSKYLFPIAFIIVFITVGITVYIMFQSIGENTGYIVASAEQNKLTQEAFRDATSNLASAARSLDSAIRLANGLPQVPSQPSGEQQPPPPV